MQVTRDRRSLRQALGEVFPSDPLPSLITELEETVDGSNARRVLAMRRWSDLSVCEIDGVRGALLVLTREAMHYHLPAFTMAAMFSGRYGQDHAEHLAFILQRDSTLEPTKRNLVRELLRGAIATLPEQPRKYWFAHDLLATLDRAGTGTSEYAAHGALARLRDRIRAVFPLGPVPPSTAIVSDPHLYTDLRGAYRLFGGEPWTTASLGQLVYERAAIHVLQPTAYAFYLPAYLCGALDPTTGGEIADSVLFSAGATIDGRRTDSREAARWGALTSEQRRVVADVLHELTVGRGSSDSRDLAIAERWRADAGSS